MFPQLVALLTDPLLYFLVTGLLAGVLLYRGKTLHALTLVAASLLSALSVDVLKKLTDVERPLNGLVEVASSSFPSGHAAGSAFLACAFVAVFWHSFKRKSSQTFFVLLVATLALSIGLSRLYLAVHRQEEVFVGFLVGLFWGTLLLFFLLQKKA